MKNIFLLLLVFAVAYLYQDALIPEMKSLLNAGTSTETSSKQNIASTEKIKRIHPDYDVVLFATSWCGYCKKTRLYFKKHGVRYFEFDVEKSKWGKQLFDERGGSGFPLTVIGNDIIKGYSTSAFERSLKKYQL